MLAWTQYLDAARRKVAIARYHAEMLQEVLSIDDASDRSMPTIAVQAHFEGVVVAVMAAVDQVAQAIFSVLALGLHQDKLVDGAFQKIAMVLPELGTWFNDPLGRDLRRIRVRIIHYSYSKTPQGDAWEVESTGSIYKGSRELLAYAHAAVVYGEGLANLLQALEKHVSSVAH